MSHFLLVYDRKAGRLVFEDEYADAERHRALADRFAAEAKYAGADIEVVVLSASNRVELERTHGRYFKSVAELAEDALAS